MPEMKKATLILAVLFALPALAQSQKDLEKPAMRGDYQAQRNLAYSFVAPMKGENLNPVAGCAWYLVILKSGSPRVDVTDTNNATLYCDRLSQTEKIAAHGKADELVRRIYKR
ncbi:hypothetical protein [Herminiimonas contaminans]|uniref:Beta/gamma crystallin n=1 Tax=Herminiimonas contaminans TaxID=1111140 RepID=A0ABS0EXV3_9BURK|nr:hypothetical protein [Herminiimonas contaminans]MBF8179662.1 hypothetical protein [Herminiimonas contaminans]